MGATAACPLPSSRLPPQLPPCSRSSASSATASFCKSLAAAPARAPASPASPRCQGFHSRGLLERPRCASCWIAGWPCQACRVQPRPSWGGGGGCPTPEGHRAATFCRRSPARKGATTIPPRSHCPAHRANHPSRSANDCQHGADQRPPLGHPQLPVEDEHGAAAAPAAAAALHACMQGQPHHEPTSGLAPLGTATAGGSIFRGQGAREEPAPRAAAAGQGGHGVGCAHAGLVAAERGAQLVLYAACVPAPPSSTTHAACCGLSTSLWPACLCSCADASTTVGSGITYELLRVRSLRAALPLRLAAPACRWLAQRWPLSTLLALSASPTPQAGAIVLAPLREETLVETLLLECTGAPVERLFPTVVGAPLQALARALLGLAAAAPHLAPAHCLRHSPAALSAPALLPSPPLCCSGVPPLCRHLGGGGVQGVCFRHEGEARRL